MSEFYVYKYVSENGTPYYIGKGKGTRIREKHLYTIVPPINQRIIIEENLTETQAFELEHILIKKYKRKLDGGLLDNIKINQWACTSGWKHSNDAKQKISKGNTGKVRSLEAKEKYKQPKTKEHAEKIRQANIGRLADNRYEKVSKTKSKQRWYNNGTITRMFIPGQEINGFILGRCLSQLHGDQK